ncbi:MAG: class I SAM-dependent methyltransferase, partial [Actinomycetota bacterium]|nr:class I SAM-dependent methyltransferase [Actinomycetota bacterium]
MPDTTKFLLSEDAIPTHWVSERIASMASCTGVSSSWSYLDAAVLPLLLGESVLDVGCGMGRWATLIETNFWEARLARAPPVDGIDAFAPNVAHCRSRGTYRNVWEHHVPDALDGAWDTVLASEILEHLPQAHLSDRRQRGWRRAAGERVGGRAVGDHGHAAAALHVPGARDAGQGPP